MKVLILSLLVIGLCLSIVSPLSIDFFYSDSCPHCQNIKPLVNSLNDLESVEVYYYETSDPKAQQLFKEAGFEGVPSFVIKTSDERVIKFSGADHKRLKCEALEMTTLECPTLSADHSVMGSWFVERL